MPKLNVASITMLTALACAVPVYVTLDAHRYVMVKAGAEDDCRLYYGAYKLDDVVGRNSGGLHYVECRYR